MENSTGAAVTTIDAHSTTAQGERFRATQTRILRFYKQQVPFALPSFSEENENEVAELTFCLVYDPVLPFLWLAIAGCGNSKCYCRIACAWSRGIYPDRQVEQCYRSYSLSRERLYSFYFMEIKQVIKFPIQPSSWRTPVHIPSRCYRRSPTRQRAPRGPVPIHGCAHARIPGAHAGYRCAAS